MNQDKLSDHEIEEWLDICQPDSGSINMNMLQDDMFKALTELKELRAKEMKDFETKRTEIRKNYELYIEENSR